MNRPMINNQGRYSYPIPDPTGDPRTDAQLQQWYSEAGPNEGGVGPAPDMGVAPMQMPPLGVTAYDDPRPSPNPYAPMPNMQLTQPPPWAAGGLSGLNQTGGAVPFMGARLPPQEASQASAGPPSDVPLPVPWSPPPRAAARVAPRRSFVAASPKGNGAYEFEADDGKKVSLAGSRAEAAARELGESKKSYDKEMAKDSGVKKVLDKKNDETTDEMRALASLFDDLVKE